MSNFNAEHNRFVWVDIPVSDLDRAAAFYGAVLGVKIHHETIGEHKFCVIDLGQGNGGCLILNAEEITADAGMLVYMNADGRIHDAVAQVTAHGGEVDQPVHAIGPHGFRAVVRDSEGNRLALHSMTDA